MISKEIVSREYISYCPTESKWTWFSKVAVHKFIWKHHRPVRLLKYTPAQVLSSKFCEIFKDSFFKEHLRMTASDNSYFWTCFITAFERDEYHKFCRWKIILCEIKEVALNRSSRPEAFCKKMFLKISQNSQENICARYSFLIKLHALRDSDIGVFPWILWNF